MHFATRSIGCSIQMICRICLLATTSKALVPRSEALVPSSFVLLLVRHLLLEARHLFLVAYCSYPYLHLTTSDPAGRGARCRDHRGE